jgi:hypothetical protein
MKMQNNTFTSLVYNIYRSNVKKEGRVCPNSCNLWAKAGSAAQKTGILSLTRRDGRAMIQANRIPEIVDKEAVLFPQQRAGADRLETPAVEKTQLLPPLSVCR